MTRVKKRLKLHEDLAKARSQAKKDAIQSEIGETDKQIDLLVYELYGLTKPEIAIVEGKAG
jgi:type II restriction/modification system DNA methylase subunit YeeA